MSLHSSFYGRAKTPQDRHPHSASFKLKQPTFLDFFSEIPTPFPKKKYPTKSCCFDVLKYDTIWLDAFFSGGVWRSRATKLAEKQHHFDLYYPPKWSSLLRAGTPQLRIVQTETSNFLGFVLLSPHTLSKKQKCPTKSCCFDVLKYDTIWLDTFFSGGVWRSRATKRAEKQHHFDLYYPPKWSSLLRADTPQLRIVQTETINFLGFVLLNPPHPFRKKSIQPNIVVLM